MTWTKAWSCDATEAALFYARRGWPVFPVRPNKVPLTRRGKNDASCDPNTIKSWWFTFPCAVPSIVTGEASGIVSLDIDIRRSKSGFDTLEELGIAIHPSAPTAHTPHGGCAILFEHPGYPIKTIAGRLGAHLDTRGDGGSLMLPPGPGRFWDPVLGPETPIGPMPAWMATEDEQKTSAEISSARIRRQPISPYAEASLDAAVTAITTAAAGRQRDTLNAQVYSIARLVGSGEIPAPLAIEALLWASRQLISYDPRRPWRVVEVEKIVRAAFVDGLAQPRLPAGRR